MADVRDDEGEVGMRLCGVDLRFLDRLESALSSSWMGDGPGGAGCRGMAGLA